MFGIQHFALFLTAGILLNLTPGPDTAFILGRTLAGGRRAGIASSLGISVGSICHTCAAAIGLSAFLATSAWAFTIVKSLGACYLFYLGLRMLLQKHQLAAPSEKMRATSFASAFRQGIVTNLLNPKVALFFLAFLPQFIAPNATAKVPAFLALGLTFVTTGTIWCLTLAWFADAMSRRLRQSERFGAWLNRAVGALFVALGIRLATTR
ncbi:MAG: LysE family translocator [Verrucomicrobiota bacterium]|nr:LysE family translocator [Verrucomicrobiota bacterium]MDQ6939835.1 LysE family translocator [Verrucomicrobiota bacterium]